MGSNGTSADGTGVGERRSASLPGFAALAEQYLSEHRVDAARELCLHGVSQVPWYAPGHIVMAKIYLECGEHEAAQQSLRRALQIDPLNSVAHTLLGQALLLQGEAEAAIQVLEEALFLCPANPLATQLMRRAKGDEIQQGDSPYRQAAVKAPPQPQPSSDEAEASALRSLSGVDGVLIATSDGLASAGTMGEGNENDEALAAGAATALQTWRRSRALGGFGAPRWAVVVGDRGQMVMAPASGKLVLARLAKQLRPGRVIPRVEEACRKLSTR